MHKCKKTIHMHLYPYASYQEKLIQHKFHKRKKKQKKKQLIENCDNSAATWKTRNLIQNLSKTRLCRLDANISPDRPSLTPQAFTGYFLQHPFCVIHNYYKLLFIFFLVKPFFFSFLGGQFKNKSSEWIIHGSHMHVKCLLKALVFGTWKKNILIYSQMRFQLYQLHTMTVIGLKNGKKSINWGPVGIYETLRLKLQT